jgi:hypothetical protein
MIRKIRKAKITAKQAASDEKIRQQAYKDFPPCCPNCGKTLETPTQVHNCVSRPTNFKVRLNDDKTIDEIFADNVSFHLEQMDNGFWWIGLTPKDNPNNRLMIHLTSKRKIVCTAESDEGDISAGFLKEAK